MDQEDGYLLDNRRAEAGVRFDALAELFDPWTFRHFDDIGVAPAWSCWEVGAGGPSVPQWLAHRVGERGRVLATDIDVSWLRDAPGDGPGWVDRERPGGRPGWVGQAGNAPAVEIRAHDVARDEPPAETFDLVHARLVLVHLPDRDRALRSMVRSLRPGGVLLIEDADPALQPLACPDEHDAPQRLANRIRAGFRRLLAARGADLGYGRMLPRLLRTAGLEDVRADAYFPMTSPACGVLEAATVRQLRDQLIAHGHATAAEIDEHLAAIAAGHVDLATAPMISAWGRRPESPSPGPVTPGSSRVGSSR
ncbi:methyltransferase domain-containing protein [Actinoallomurus sp. NPDC050550]|uniref:class I SAM-dependent methyltransferase n=1 Tax=Actinoallomurus sp. NPDC050550 TaxID=3154937 RepID=UPI0033FBA0CA